MFKLLSEHKSPSKLYCLSFLQIDPYYGFNLEHFHTKSGSCLKQNFTSFNVVPI